MSSSSALSVFPAMVLCLLVVPGSPLWAGRATPEQMEQLRKESAHLADDPVANYAKIPPRLMIGSSESCSSLVTRFQERLKTSTGAEEQAVLHFLIAEGRYHGAIAKLLAAQGAKKRPDFQPAVEHYLTAFTLAIGDQEKPELAQHIAAQFIRCLKSGACSGTDKNAVDLRERVVHEFVEPLESSSSVATLPASDKARLYKTLGIEKRLAAALPNEPPEALDELQTALQQAIECGATEKVSLFADALWARRGAKGKEPPLTVLLNSCSALASVPGREEDAWNRLSEFSQTYSKANLELFRLSPTLRPTIELPQRLGFLDRYVELASLPGLAKPLPCLRIAAETLAKEKLWEQAVGYLDRALGLPEATGSPAYAALLLQKGDYLVRLGRVDQAREAYGECRTAAQHNDRTTAQLASDRIARLPAIVDKEKH